MEGESSALFYVHLKGSATQREREKRALLSISSLPPWLSRSEIGSQQPPPGPSRRCRSTSRLCFPQSNSRKLNGSRAVEPGTSSQEMLHNSAHPDSLGLWLHPGLPLGCGNLNRINRWTLAFCSLTLSHPLSCHSAFNKKINKISNQDKTCRPRLFPLGCQHLCWGSSSSSGFQGKQSLGLQPSTWSLPGGRTVLLANRL